MKIWYVDLVVVTLISKNCDKKTLFERFIRKNLHISQKSCTFAVALEGDAEIVLQPRLMNLTTSPNL